MIKTLTKHGNRLALIIDPPILDLLKIEVDTPLGISTDGTRLIVSPGGPTSRQKAYASALKKTDQKYSRALKKLAE